MNVSFSQPAVALLLLGVVGAIGYLIGSHTAATQSEAMSSERAAYRESFRESRKSAFERSISRGLRIGSRRGEAAGQRIGISRGSDDAYAAINSTADTWCDPTDPSYCLQTSPGAGGSPCPPGTVENAGGVVCVPIG